MTTPEIVVTGLGLLGICVFWFIAKRDLSKMPVVDDKFYLVARTWEGEEHIFSGTKTGVLDIIARDNDYAEFTIYTAERYDAMMEERMNEQPSRPVRPKNITITESFWGSKRD